MRGGGEGLLSPTLGFLHCWESKGIFQFLMIPLTVCLLAILFTLRSRLLLPFPVTASISPPASSSICFTFPSLFWTVPAQERRKREVDWGAKLGGKSPAGVFEAAFVPRIHQGVSRRRAGQEHITLGGRSCPGQEVLRHTACAAICVWDLSRSYQDDAEASLHPSCLLDSLALFCSPPLPFFFCPDIINVNQMLCAQLLAS